MEQAGRTQVLIGNVLQTIWAVIYLILGVLSVGLKLAGALPKHSVWQPDIVKFLILLVLVIICWVGMSKLASAGWRAFYLIWGIVSIIFFGNLIAGILFIVAFVAANNAAKSA